MPQRKRARGSSTSQIMDEKPAWVGHFFDIMSIVESNFNNRFDQVDARLSHFDHHIDHMEYDYHTSNFDCP